MAGKAYTLPRPQPDVQPKAAGADEVGYETGFTPRPRYARSSASDAWRNAADSVTNALHCNLQTRISTAPLLDDGAQRDLGVNTYTPGRKPAPRVALSCVTAPERLTRPSSAYARDLALTRPEKPPRNPDGGPLAGPGPSPTGLSPLPDAAEPVPRTAPTLVLITTPPPPTVSPELAAEFLLQQNSPRTPGTLQTINFHLTGDIAGGSATTELRVFGPISSPFIIRQLWINAESGITPGQFLDVLISPDGNSSDVANPSGASIFELLGGFANIPTPDNQRGIAIPPVFQELKLAVRVDQTNRFIKLQTLFIAPAVALPNCHVTIAIERLDLPNSIVPSIIPRPPLLAPTYEPPTITGTGSPALPPPGTSGPQPYATTPSLLPAWRVAALGLPPNTGAGVIGSYPLVDSYSAWLLSPDSKAATLFRDRIKQVLTAAEVPEGNAFTLIPSAVAIQPTTTPTR